MRNTFAVCKVYVVCHYCLCFYVLNTDKFLCQREWMSSSCVLSLSKALKPHRNHSFSQSRTRNLEWHLVNLNKNCRNLVQFTVLFIVYVQCYSATSGYNSKFTIFIFCTCFLYMSYLCYFAHGTPEQIVCISFWTSLSQIWARYKAIQRKKIYLVIKNVRVRDIFLKPVLVVCPSYWVCSIRCCCNHLKLNSSSSTTIVSNKNGICRNHWATVVAK